MTTERILVIEDNPDNMTLVVDVLRSLGFDVLQATDGEAGVRVAVAEQPDLILMDLSLPRLDGWAATRQLKAMPLLRDTPIIALTAHSMVSKPINLRELAQKIHRFLQV
jgi:two-component system cell cycle response regulator DivK